MNYSSDGANKSQMPLASAEHAPSIPMGPMQLALAAQREIKLLHRKADVEGLLIRQLIVGRFVKRKVSSDVYLVTEIKLGIAGTASLFGKPPGKKQKRHIGVLSEVEIVPGESAS